MEAEESTPLETVTKQQLLKAQQTEEGLMGAVVNYRVCELTLVL
jgi:hypothetical protein